MDKNHRYCSHAIDCHLPSFSGNTITTEDIVDRIIRHRLEFETRNQKKEKKEIEVYEAMQKVKLAQKSGWPAEDDEDAE